MSGWGENLLTNLLPVKTWQYHAQTTYKLG